MKKLLFIALITTLHFTANSQDTAKAEAKLTAATVYYGYGAELTHEAKINVSNNVKQIVIKYLSTNLDQNSLQISVPENVMLLSQKYMIFYPTVPATTASPLVKALQDSITSVNTILRRNNIQISIEEQTLEKTGNLIENVVEKTDSKTISAEDALKLLNAYTTKIEKAKMNIFNLTENASALNAKIAAYQKRINEVAATPTKPEKPYGQLILQVICRTSGEIPVSLSYFTNTAGWTPLYDLRVNSKTNELKLVYKASVTQSTGIDWKQTKLTLSTGTPSLATTAPILSAWYLRLFVPQLYNEAIVSGNAYKYAPRNSIQSTYKDDKKIEEYNTATDNVEPSTLQDFTTLKESQLNTNFEIDLPYDIESDGQLHVVNIKDEKINATLKNYAVPKLDKDAYLLAEVSDWQNLDLLPGTANIIMDNTYLGKSYIDPNSTADTLNLSLGKDRRVAVKRSAVKDFTSTKTNGNTTKQIFTYEITVKNNKLTTVDLILKDQYPISSEKDIEVKLEDDGKALNNPEVGVLTWKLQLKPGESKKVRFSYTVKYPKDKKVANL